MFIKILVGRKYLSNRNPVAAKIPKLVHKSYSTTIPYRYAVEVKVQVIVDVSLIKFDVLYYGICISKIPLKSMTIGLLLGS